DYRSVNGVMEPYSITIGEGNSTLSVAVDSVQHNAAIEAERLDYPKISGRPLPEVETLLKSLTANQEKIEELREHYTFREVQTEHVLEGGGRVKDTHVKTLEVTPVAGQLVERLVNDDGKALSTSEQEKEDRRVQKEVEGIIKRKEKKDEKKAKEAERGKQDSERDEDQVTVLKFLKTSEVTSERWEKMDGKDVIAFDFEPRPHFKAHGSVESLISKLAGTMWIDPDAQQVARLQAHFTGSFKVGGGLLASVGQSTAFSIEQKNVDGEVWLPSCFEANVSARVMLLARFNRTFTTVYTDYRKYQINSKYELKHSSEEEKRLP
ncbi:MAG TPA: hypothetical protein VEZ90_18410, partial [Blastocatellia bacterium]|nr:hypothetical protein [Blastocatellia bacterium]